MEKFLWYNPTKLYFGKNQIESLHDEFKKYKKVLLVYGGGSIKKMGLYDKIISILNDEHKEYIELGGIEPNPKISSVKEGIKIVREKNIDLILAAGGGSTIDCAKAIAVGALSKHDIMDILLGKEKADEGVPVGAILTLAATGTEMNPRSVISNMEENLKLGIGTWDKNATYPTFSICDPTYTLTVPKNQTVNGIVDIMSHVLEQYFNQNENNILGDRMAESLLKTMIDIAPKLLNDLTNYELRETMMICGTMAWNGILRGLSNNGDWACHKMEHAISAVYDIAHGEGLAIITPVWMEYCLDINPTKFKQFAQNVFNINPNGKTDREIGMEGIKQFKAFLKSIGAPVSMKQYKIKTYNIDSLVEKSMLNKSFIGQYVKLTDKDVYQIIQNIF